MPKKILVVDDDRNIGQILHASFSAKGYETIVSGNGEDALIKFEEIKPDLILLDVLLPKMNGWEVCKQIKATEQGAKTIVILMSAIYKNYKMQQDALAKYGADTFVEKPFQLSRLMTTVSGFIGEGEEAVLDEAIFEDQGSADDGQVLLNGDLGSVSFPELLHDIYVMGKSGILTMARDDVEKEISIKQGYPVSAKTNINRELLGNYLVRIRKITKAQNEESLALQKESHRLQGTILIEMELLSPSELVHYLTLQMREKIFEIFSWRNGTYEFIEDSTVTGDISAIDMSTANVIFFGIKSHFDLDYCLEKMEPYFERYLRLGSNQYYRFQDLELTPSESKLLLKIDGTQIIDDLARNSPLDPLQTYQLILTLIYSGMCEAAPEPSAQPDSFFDSLEEAEDEKPTRQMRIPSAAKKADATDSESDDFIIPMSDEDESSVKKTAFKLPERQEEPESQNDDAHDEKASQRRKIQEKFDQVEQANMFEILNLETRNPTEHEVRTAYHKLAKEYHPDKFFGNLSPDLKNKVETIFQSISDSYENLNTQEKINKYIKKIEGEQPAEKRSEARLEGVKKIIQAEQLYQNGIAFVKEKRYTRAADSLRKAIELSGNEPEYIAYYGWALYNMPMENDLDEEELEMRGSYTDADFQFQGREHLNRAIAINPRTEKAYLFLGFVYKNQGLKEFAERQFEKALICNPNSIESLRELRLIKLEAQKRSKKTGIFDRIFKRK